MLIPIAFVLYFDVIAPLLDQEFLNNLGVESIVRLVFACVMALMLTGFNAALILLNVYIPTSVGNWLSNAAKLLFKVPLLLAVTGGLMWFPLVFAFLSFQYFFYFGMVFIVVYYMLSALGITMMMKSALIDCLVEAREEGILTDERAEERSDEDDAE